MGVKRCKTVAVVQDHVAAITLAAALVADLDDLACKSGNDCAVFTVAETEVYTAMHAVLARTVMTCNTAAFRRDDGRRHVEDK